MMDDLKAFGVPVLILSGGEPLLRPDIFEIARARQGDGLLRRPVHQRHADRRAQYRRASPRIGFDYVGISLDGIGATHDRFRRQAGAFDAALSGIAPVPRARHQGRPALHHDRGQLRTTCRRCSS